ncbi:MAG TPA: DUF892 family protein [Chloroflexota bacterium]
MHESRNQLINWLNDAAGMEDNLVNVLEHQVDDFKPYPDIQQAVRRHLEVTKNHADMVRDCVKQLGGSPSTVKQAMGKIQGIFAGLSTGPADDEMVKNLLADFGSENFEIACYTSLISACNEIGESQISSVCQRILQDEKNMAQTVLDAIPRVTNDYLVQKGHEKAA